MTLQEQLGQPAEYDDRYFDSLTEARWAAYFDIAGMPYQREPATYEFTRNVDLESGENATIRAWLYTPDYLLTNQQMFVEVKNGNADDGTASKLATLARSTGQPGMLIDGRPGACGIYMFYPRFSPTPERSHRYGFSYDQFFAWNTLSGRAIGTILQPVVQVNPQLASELRRLDMQVGEAEFSVPSEDLALAAIARRQQMRENPIVI